MPKPIIDPTILAHVEALDQRLEAYVDSYRANWAVYCPRGCLRDLHVGDKLPEFCPECQVVDLNREKV